MNTPTLQAYVVEDNPSLCENLVGTLHELTCVRVVATGQSQAQAAAWLAAHPDGWDLLVIDLFLPGGSGMHLVEQLGGRKPWQKVVIFSNYVTAGVRKRSAQLGVDAVFDKSTEIDALIDYCARLCFLRGSAAGGALRGAGGEPPAGPHRPVT